MTLRLSISIKFLYLISYYTHYTHDIQVFLYGNRRKEDQTQKNILNNLFIVIK